MRIQLYLATFFTAFLSLMVWQTRYVLTHATFLNNFSGKGFGAVSFTIGVLCVILGVTMKKREDTIFGSYILAIGVTVFALGFLDLFNPTLASGLKVIQLNS
jgi:hypothetical protein